MAYQWLSTAIRTGEILADLHGLKCDTISSQLMAYTSAEASLPLPTAPKNWRRATLDMASTFILVDGDTPIWGGMVIRSVPDNTDTLPISLATPEAYFDRVYVRDEVYTQVGQNLIIKTLVEKYADTIPIRVVILNGGDGKLRDRTYKDSDDKTLYSVLQELSGVEGGPEWTIAWEWLHDPERYTMILYVGDHVGSTVTPGLAPQATFEMPGSIISFQAPRDYGTGKGANDVMAVSTAQADTRPQSPHIVVEDPDRPRIEERFTPSTSIDDVGVLTSHAQAKSKALAGGTRSLALTARADAYPRLGFDWRIGDEVGYKVGGTRPAKFLDILTDIFDDVFGSPVIPARELVPAFPGGIEGIIRPVGWELKLGQDPTVTPILVGDLGGI